MYQLYQPFIEYLNKTSGIKFDIKLYPTYRETIEQFGHGRIAIIACGPVPYIRAKEKYPAIPLLRPLNRKGKPRYQGVVIVRQGSPVQDLADLRGKSFAFGQPLSTAGRILPEYHLRKSGVSLKDLEHYAFLRHHDSVAYAVLKGQFDAGAVKDVIAYKYQKEGLRFLLFTEPLSTGPILVRPDTPPKIVAAVKTALLKLNAKNPAHRRLMESWDEEFKYGFTEASDADYDPIRKIMRMIDINLNDQDGSRN